MIVWVASRLMSAPAPPAPANVAGNTYDKYASTNPLERKMMAGFFRALDHMLDGMTPATIVEVGAGEGRITGRLAERFPGATVIGLDLQDDALLDEWLNLGVPMFFGDATRLPFADRSIDLIIGLEVLEHIPQPERALAEIARVGKAAVMSVPNEPIWRVGNVARRRYISDWGNTPGHINHWSTRSFRQFVSQRFDITKSASPLPWTMVSATPR